MPTAPLILLILTTLLHQSSAKQCPPGSILENNKYCEKCQPGTYRDPTRTSCDPCPPGTANPSFAANSLAECKPCPAGTIAELRNIVSPIGATKCVPCPSGTFSLPRAITCLKCRDGTFARKRGSVKCKKCPRRRISRPGYKRCLKGCPPGSALSPKKSVCRKCRPGTFRPPKAPSTICLLCPAGTTSGKGATKCKKCPKGTSRKILISFRNRKTVVRPECSPCEPNTFADVKGLVTCKLCPLGTVAKEGATKCKSCPAGTFRSQIDPVTAGTCTPCPKGTTSLGKKPAGCKHPKKGCPVNTFEDKDGECRACMPGKRLDMKKKRCVRCGKRQISRGGVTTVCKTCPRGQAPADADSLFEKAVCACLPGSETNQVGGCRTCPIGTSWVRLGIFVNGREPFFREALCLPCSSGTISDKPGLTECKPCPFGTFTSFRNTTSCTKCPTGTTTDPGDPAAFDDSVSRTCFNKRDGCELGGKFEVGFGCKLVFSPPGKILSPNGRSCHYCDKNKFSDANLECVKCPAGQASLGGLVTKCTVCPKGADAFSDGTCRCMGRFGDDGKGGCKRCPKGQISITGSCGRCPEGTRPIVRGGVGSCDPCEGEKILPPGERRCKKCPKGFVKDEDVFGLPAERCVPADKFFF